MVRALLLSALLCCGCGGDWTGANRSAVAFCVPSIPAARVGSNREMGRLCSTRTRSRPPLGAETSAIGEAGAAGEGAEEGQGATSGSLVKPRVRSVADEKASLMRLILTTSIEEKDSAEKAEQVNNIINSLKGVSKGFQEEKVDGEWVLCFTRNSQGSPSLQKALPGDRGFQNFDIRAKKFFNIAQLWGGKVKVSADVSYEVLADMPNRLQSTIVATNVKLGPLRIPLPLTGRVGYLEFLYQDDDIRITRGNRGGLFLHMRPSSSFAMESGAAQA